MRFWLEYEAQLVELPAGESLVGRALGCWIRFNDPAVSREHLRLVVEQDGVSAEDLGSTNGTLLNDQPLRGKHRLKDGDKVAVGGRHFRIAMGSPEKVGAEDEGAGKRTSPGVSVLPRDVAPAVTGSEAPGAVDVTVVTGGQSSTPPRPLTAVQPEDLAGRLGPQQAIEVQNCPRCRALVSFEETVCPRCKYKWPNQHPSSPTQRINLKDVDRRRQPRYAVHIPALYSSEALTVHGTARDLSEGGVFVASELLDPVGTQCEVQMLPDGHPVVRFAGQVCHVVQSAAGQGGRPPGLGIQFKDLCGDARKWLAAELAHRARTHLDAQR